MSTRFVWNRYNVNISIEEIGTGFASKTSHEPETIDYTADPNNIDWAWGNNVTETDRVNGYGPFEGHLELTQNGDSGTIPANRYFVSSTRAYKTTSTMNVSLTTPFGSYWYEFDENANKQIGAVKSKGTAAGTLSNAASSTYPLNNTLYENTIICVFSASLLRWCSYVD